MEKASRARLVKIERVGNVWHKLPKAVVAIYEIETELFIKVLLSKRGHQVLASYYEVVTLDGTKANFNGTDELFLKFSIPEGLSYRQLESPDNIGRLYEVFYNNWVYV